MIADVEVDEHVDLPPSSLRGLLIPLDLLNVIYGYHGTGLDDASHLRRIGHWRSQKDAGNSRARHQLRLGKGSYAHAAGPGGDLPLRDLHALVSLGVRANGFAGTLHLFHHAREICLKRVQIQ